MRPEIDRCRREIASIEALTLAAEETMQATSAEAKAKSGTAAATGLAAGQLKTEVDTLAKLLTPTGDAGLPAILDAIKARQFGLVVLEESLDEPPRPLISARFTEPVRTALQAAYTPAGQQAGYWFYRPSSDQK